MLTGIFWIVLAIFDIFITSGEKLLEAWLILLGLCGIFSGVLLNSFPCLMYTNAIINAAMFFLTLDFLIGQPTYELVDGLPFLIISAAVLGATAYSYLEVSARQNQRPVVRV